MWTNERAVKEMKSVVDALAVAVALDRADGTAIAAGCVQAGMLALIELGKPLPPSLLMELAQIMAERGRLGEVYGAAETVPAQRVLPCRN
jgi:hypothetical protein